MLGKLQWELSQKNIYIENVNYTEKVIMRIYVPLSYKLDIEQFILNITSGDGRIKWIGTYYIDQYNS